MTHEPPPFGETAPKTERLRRRADFLLAAKAFHCARGAVAAQARDRHDTDPLMREGFTATRRIGGAVARNRCKRRLREAARIALPLYGRPGCDYVFIARGGTARREWPALVDDMKSALLRLATDIDGARAS